MRLDDLQLLRLIDDRENAGQYGELSTGYAVYQAASDGGVVDPARPQAEFVRELLLARDGDYVEWVENQVPAHVRRPDPRIDANWWLQEVRDIRLTIADRDRGRGRVVVRELPDPDEDDGRLITGMTLEEIARAIGETYTATQLPRYLRDCGVAEDVIPDEVLGSRWEYVLDVLERLDEGGSAARRALREFIGGWVTGTHHAPPRADVQKRIVALLGQQGWHVRDGRLVIGPKSTDAAGRLTPLGRDARIAALHPEVRLVADRFLESGHMDAAIFEAFKLVNITVKAMTGLDVDGHKLMATAFADAAPRIVLAERSTETGRNIQAGFRYLFMGAVQGIRNPDAHEQFTPLDDEEALEKLAFASMLMRRLDAASVSLPAV